MDQQDLSLWSNQTALVFPMNCNLHIWMFSFPGKFGPGWSRVRLFFSVSLGADVLLLVEWKWNDFLVAIISFYFAAENL